MTAVVDAPAEALRAGARPRRFGAWYVFEHFFLQIRPFLRGMIVMVLGNPLVYLFAMGVGLGSLIGSNLGPHAVDGVSYLAFLAPALLATSGLTVGVEAGTFPVVSGFLWNPIFTGMNAAPIAPGQIMGGLYLFTTARLLLTTGVYYCFMLLFGAVPDPGLGALSILAATLTGLAIHTVVAAFAATIEVDRGQFNYVFRFVVMPLTLFSGTYFPLSSMPVYLQWIGWISPLWHGTQLARVLSYGAVEPGWLIAVHLAYLVAMFATGWAISLRVARRRLGR